MSPKSKALKVKQLSESSGFHKHHKVLQGEAKKHGDKVVFLKGYDKRKEAMKNRKPVSANDLPY